MVHFFHKFVHFPAPEDDYDYLPYIKALADSGYQDILTVEATSVREDFFTEAKICLNYLHELEKQTS